MANRLNAEISAARAAGMSYGKWKALHPCVEIEEAKPEPGPKKEAPKIPCAFCGELFAACYGRKYCSDACRTQKNAIASRERYWTRKAQAVETDADADDPVRCENCRHYEEVERLQKRIAELEAQVVRMQYHDDNITQRRVFEIEFSKMLEPVEAMDIFVRNMKRIFEGRKEN